MILGRGFRRQRRIGRQLGSGCWRLSVNYALSVARKGRGGGFGEEAIYLGVMLD